MTALTKEQWEASVAEAWSASIKATYQDLIDEAVKAEREACIVDIQMHIPRSGRHTPEYQMAMRMIERIRARGTT